MLAKTTFAAYVAIIILGVLGIFFVEILPGYFLETELTYGKF
jgi:uncharacterized membrane protein|tara:strand:- start:219 stop:344 length:126 start_codon:yes stop_codon:yes gene_type:complete